jgi:plastocyanin
MLSHHPHHRSHRAAAIVAVVLAVAIILVVAVAATGCGSSSNSTTTAGTPATTSSAAQVVIKGFAFDPASITIKAGESVTWTNQDSPTHTITADNGEFDSGNIASGATYSFTFAKAGTYPYHCTIHPSMKGTVVVQ